MQLCSWSACFLLVTLLFTSLPDVFSFSFIWQLYHPCQTGKLLFAIKLYTQAHCARLSIRATFLPLNTSPVFRLMTVWGRKEGWDCVMLAGSLAVWLDRGCLSSWSVDLPGPYFLRVAFFQSKINCRKCLSEFAHYINLPWSVFYGILLLNRILLEINWIF